MLPTAIMGAAFLVLSACGNGPDVIVSDAGGPATGGAPNEVEPAEGQGPAEQTDDDHQGDDQGEVEAAIEEIRDDLDGENVSGEDALDVLEPLDEEPTAAELREARNDREDAELAVVDGPRNEAGEMVELDEAAALACADVERALTSIDEGETATATADVASAATRAGGSAVADIATWSQALGEWNGADDDSAALLGFLATCTEGGYEL